MAPNHLYLLDRQALAGKAGVHGPEGPPGSVRQIVVGEEVRTLVDIEVEYGFEPVGDHQYVAAINPLYGEAFNTIWNARCGQWVVVEGSSFPPNTEVIITICEDNRVWADTESNDCGAFALNLKIPTWADRGPISVNAWTDSNDNSSLEEDKGEKQASWPLEIYVS